MKNIIYFLAFAALLASCKKKDAVKYSELNKAAWLTGNWQNEIEGGTMTETWEKANDSTYFGASYFTKNNAKDTIHLESVELTERKGVVSYNPTVQGQNDGKSIPFRLTSATDKLLVFENPKHDYPQKITYRKVTNDSLVAEISGKQQGKADSEKYPMKRKSE